MCWLLAPRAPTRLVPSQVARPQVGLLPFKLGFLLRRCLASEFEAGGLNRALKLHCGEVHAGRRLLGSGDGVAMLQEPGCAPPALKCLAGTWVMGCPQGPPRKQAGRQRCCSCTWQQVTLTRDGALSLTYGSESVRSALHVTFSCASGTVSEVFI